jgi:hypothetical protein
MPRAVRIGLELMPELLKGGLGIADFTLSVFRVSPVSGIWVGPRSISRSFAPADPDAHAHPQSAHLASSLS